MGLGSRIQGSKRQRIQDPNSTTLHPALQNMKFLNFFLLLWVSFALPDPDSEYGSRFGSTDLIESGFNLDLDPKPWCVYIYFFVSSTGCGKKYRT
jgi:hypothetical protein